MIRKVFYAILFVFFTQGVIKTAYSQIVITNDTIRVECELTPVGDEFIFDKLEIKNNSSTTYKFKVSKVIAAGDTVTGTETYFCDNVCYPAATYVSPSAKTIAANSTFTTFSHHYMPHGFAGTSTVKYEFFNSNNPSESVYVVFKTTAKAGPTINGNAYVVNLDFPSSVKGQDYAKSIIVSPNPANNKLFVTLANSALGKSNLRIYDLLGNLMSEKIVNGADKVEVETEFFANGIYYLKIEQNNKAVATKKIVVAH